MASRKEHRVAVTYALPETEQMVECTTTGSDGAVVKQLEIPLAAVRLGLKESMTAEDVERIIDHLLFTGTATALPSTIEDNPDDKTAATFRLKMNG